VGQLQAFVNDHLSQELVLEGLEVLLYVIGGTERVPVQAGFLPPVMEGSSPSARHSESLERREVVDRPDA
jgi:hypothetical protein